MNNHELDNETNQAHNNSSQFMKQSLVKFNERVMNRIKTYHQVHKIPLSSWSSLMNFQEKAMNWIDSTKFIQIHDCSWTSPYELHDINHEHH